MNKFKELVESTLSGKDMLKKVQAYKWKGSHAQDSGMFNQIDKWVLSNHKQELKIAAQLLKISYVDGMGLKEDRTDKEIIAEFLKEQ